MDARTRIITTFIELVTDQGFEPLTIKALAYQAEINRATFYRHFEDKYDLAIQIVDVMLIEMTDQKDLSDISPVDMTNLLFVHVAEYALFYKAMIGRFGFVGFREAVRDALERDLLRYISAHGFDDQQLDMPVALPLRYFAAAQVGFVQWWLENDMPFPPEEAAHHLMTLHTFGASKVLGMVP